MEAEASAPLFPQVPGRGAVDGRIGSGHDTDLPHPPRLGRASSPLPDLGRLLPRHPHDARRSAGADVGRPPGDLGGACALDRRGDLTHAPAPQPARLGGVSRDGLPQQRDPLHADGLGTAPHRDRAHLDPERGDGDLGDAGGGGRLPGRTADGAEGGGCRAGVRGRGAGRGTFGAWRARPAVARADGRRGRDDVLRLRRRLGAGAAWRACPGGGGGGDADGVEPRDGPARHRGGGAARLRPRPGHLGGHRVCRARLHGFRLSPLLPCAGDGGVGEPAPLHADDPARGDQPRRVRAGRGAAAPRARRLRGAGAGAPRP